MFGEALVEQLRKHEYGATALSAWIWASEGESVAELEQELDCLVFEGKLEMNNHTYMNRITLEDEELLEFIRTNPNTSVMKICARFSLPWAIPEGGYSSEAKALRNQLQRLRRAGKIKTGDVGQRWILT